VRYENAVASHSLEFAVQNAMRYRLSATLYKMITTFNSELSDRWKQRPSSPPVCSQIFITDFLNFYSLIFIVVCDLFSLMFILVTTSTSV